MDGRPKYSDTDGCRRQRGVIWMPFQSEPKPLAGTAIPPPK